MSAAHAAIGIAMVAVNLLAGTLGAWAWWRAGERSGEATAGGEAPGRDRKASGRGSGRAFWPLLRAGQALAVLAAADGLLLVALSRELPQLHLVYGLTPLAVSFLAEQLRLASADSVLQARGLEGTAAVAALPDAAQRGLVLAIVRREMGVMAASALVVAALGLRAGEWL